MITAIYAGSFDPITNGHLDIIKRASSLFDELIVGIYDRPRKNLLFTIDERVKLAKEAVKDMPKVKVVSYSGLTVEFAKEVGAKVMVRGLRMSSDFEGEFEMAMMNKKLAPDLELVCFMTSLQYQFLSSSLLKEVAQLGGCLEEMLPGHVAKALTAKYASKPC
ncbi:MAG: pantetheine-phosphate adenylyltransferase [Chloroflexi bacterium]|nr:pantetheine-phosphate adenylyltransferase [Chloroflexota bacterium]MBM4451657.1 pantetheine-phosphate adenylyltransferase [Chloroflexota bacterium]MBM4454457.1 pantetheine-phosphate adenylyltransferase [Chloroflexota bacterium]